MAKTINPERLSDEAGSITYAQRREIVRILTERGEINGKGLLVAGYGVRLNMPKRLNQYHDDPRQVFANVSAADASRWIGVHQ